MLWARKPSGEKVSDSDGTQSAPLARAYSHEDSGEKALLNALNNGFGSFEADIWLADGKILVGHDFKDLDPDRTLEELYLKPLLERVRENNGFIYTSWLHSVQLLLDVKTAPEPTYKVLHELLEKYKEILTASADGIVSESAVTVVISGERPLALMEAQGIRYAACDGRLSDLGSGRSAALMPLISDEWSYHFKWQGQGKMPAEERRKLRDIVKAAHANGQRCRFWATPDKNPAAREAVWQELVAAKVDYIVSDHPAALATWLRSNDPQPSVPEIIWFQKPRNAEGQVACGLPDKWFFNARGPLSKHWRVHAEKTIKNSFRNTRSALHSLKKKWPHIQIIRK